ncbi:MAG TPA: YggT family protein [Candidatus Saccharimonadia bacterium]
MISAVFLEFVIIFVRVFYVLLLLRVVMSWVASPTNRLYAWVVSATEPLLAPIRELLPRNMGLDLSPLVAFILLQVIQLVIVSLFSSQM